MKKNLAIGLIACTLFSCKKKEADFMHPVYKVSYTIGCTDCQVIYYSDSLQNQQTENNQNSSWSYTFYGKKGQEVLLFAFNTSSQPQGVTATILLNDEVIETATNYCAISGYSFVVDTIQ